MLRRCNHDMPMSVEARRRSKAAGEALRPKADALPVCSVPGCGRPTEARQGNGFSPFLCRYHREHRSRHGSPLTRSYTAAELRPYLKAAESIVKACAAEQYVDWSLTTIASLLASAGPVRRVVDLGRLSPETKAKASLAMLRERNVPPERILAVTLAVLAAIAEDPFGPGGDRVLFRRVQIAKALRRRASGTHVVYEGTGVRLDRYPRSSGRVLERLGEVVEGACEFAIDRHVAAVLDLKKARYGDLKPPEKASFARSRHGNERVPPAPPLPESSRSSSPGVASESTETADRIAEEVRRDFAERGFEAFKGGF